eukprot:gene9301-19305_t
MGLLQSVKFPKYRALSTISDSLKRLDRTKEEPTSNSKTSDEPKLGFDLVHFRAASIVKFITETNMMKVLEIHANGKLIDNIGKSSTIDITGCTDNDQGLEDIQKYKQYSNTCKLDLTATLPYDNGSFHCVVCLLPLKSTVGYTHFLFSEIERILTSSGYVLFGTANKIWETEQVISILEDYHEKNILNFLTLQTIDIPDTNTSSNSTSISSTGGISAYVNVSSDAVISNNKFHMALLRKF